MKNIFRQEYFRFLLLGLAIGYYTCRFAAPRTEYKVQDIYYDGEGNQIPNEMVQLLVTSQFVTIDSSEQNELNEYFYATKIKE